MRWRRKIR